MDNNTGKRVCSDCGMESEAGVPLVNGGFRCWNCVTRPQRERRERERLKEESRQVKQQADSPYRVQ